MKDKLFRKADIIIVAVLAAAALCFFLWQSYGSEKTVAEISVDGKVIETVDLSAVTDAVTFTPETDWHPVTVAENGTIRFESSDCPDKICVRKGKLHRKGDSAVCLPAKTVITVRGGGVDALTY